jgi:ferritin-like metal-binding protein YciE
MNASQQKVVQYLNEARLSEDALVRVLQSQIAVTPRGSYRSGLEAHLSETREHAARVGGRLEALGQGSNPLMAVVGFWENVIGQTVALYKTPLDLLRGSGREQKVLKNAKDACAAEALEIATYTAIERLARSVGDDETASMAASILAEEEKMLQRILREIPKLTEAVVDADVKGKPSYDVTATGAADAVREAAEREIPGVAAAAGALTGAVATAQDLPIADYDKQTAHDIAARLKGFSQRELRMIGAYEAKHENRWTITDRIAKLTGDEPWPGYDEQNVDAITTALADGDADTAHKVRSYERDHKDRRGVVDAADRHTSN